MARKKFSTLTEPMFYLLMSLRGGKKCGTQCLCQYEIDEEPRGGRCHCDGDGKNG